MRSLTASNSTMRTGFGEATTWRQPRPASSLNVQPVSAALALASSSERKAPTGLVGFRNAGSDGSTTVCVTTQAVERSMPRSFMSFRMAWDSW